MTTPHFEEFLLNKGDTQIKVPYGAFIVDVVTNGTKAYITMFYDDEQPKDATMEIFMVTLDTANSIVRSDWQYRTHVKIASTLYYVFWHLIPTETEVQDAADN